MSIDITGNGDFEIPETASRVFLSVAGTFGTASVAVGFYTNRTAKTGFRPLVAFAAKTVNFDDVITTGQSLPLVVQVTGAGGTTLNIVHRPVG